MINQPGSPPLRLHEPDSLPVPDEDTIPTVSAVTANIKACLEKGFTSVRVVGEVSSLSLPPSGHVYFCLKDSAAVLKSVMFRTAAVRHRYFLKEGMQI